MREVARVRLTGLRAHVGFRHLNMCIYSSRRHDKHDSVQTRACPGCPVLLYPASCTHTCTHSRLDDAVPAWAPSRGDSSQAKAAAPLSWGLLSAHSSLPFDSFPSPTPFKAHPQSPHTMPRNLYGVSTGCRMKGSTGCPDHQEKW